MQNNVREDLRSALKRLCEPRATWVSTRDNDTRVFSHGCHELLQRAGCEFPRADGGVIYVDTNMHLVRLQCNRRQRQTAWVDGHTFILTPSY